MKRTTDITITYTRRRRVRKSRTQTVVHCPACESESEMITVSEAVIQTGIGRTTLYRWIASGQIHASRSRGGEFQICRRSLSSRLASGGTERI